MKLPIRRRVSTAVSTIPFFSQVVAEKRERCYRFETDDTNPVLPDEVYFS